MVLSSEYPRVDKCVSVQGWTLAGEFGKVLPVLCVCTWSQPPAPLPEEEKEDPELKPDL